MFVIITRICNNVIEETTRFMQAAQTADAIQHARSSKYAATNRNPKRLEWLRFLFQTCVHLMWLLRSEVIERACTNALKSLRKDYDSVLKHARVLLNNHARKSGT